MVEISENCTSCTLNVVQSFSSWVGFPCITLRCVHSRSKKTEVSAPRLKLLSTVAFTAFLLTMLFLHWLSLAAADDVLETISALASTLFCARSGFAVCVGFFKKHATMTHFRGVEALLSHWQRSSGKVLLEVKEVRKIRAKCFAYLLCTMVFLTVYAVYMMAKIDFTLRLVVEKLTTLCCLYIDLILTFNLSLTADIYRVFFTKYQADLKRSLKEHEAKPTKTPLKGNWTELRDVRRLHSALVANFKQVNKFYDPGIAIWLLIAVAMLVSNYYLIVVVWFYGQYDASLPEFVELEIQLFTSAVVIVNNLIVFESLSHVNEDLLSFLFRYPLSQLSRMEADQVEMFIITLHAQRPVLRPSNIFTISTRLLASITGTVVTYVLVALQFHDSWAK